VYLYSTSARTRQEIKQKMTSHRRGRRTGLWCFNDGGYKEILDGLFEGVSNPQLEQVIIKAIMHLQHRLDEAQEKLPIVVDSEEPE